MSQNMTPEFEAAVAVMSALVSRPDHGLFSYEETADMAYKYAPALADRFNEEHSKKQQAKQAIISSMMPPGKVIFNPALASSFELYFDEAQKVKVTLPPTPKG